MRRLSVLVNLLCCCLPAQGGRWDETKDPFAARQK